MVYEYLENNRSGSSGAHRGHNQGGSQLHSNRPDGAIRPNRRFAGHFSLGSRRVCGRQEGTKVMELQFVESFVKELEDLGSEIVQDLGVFGASLIASIRYDAEKAFDAAVQAGKFAKETFEEVGSKELADFWPLPKHRLLRKPRTCLRPLTRTAFMPPS